MIRQLAIVVALSFSTGALGNDQNWAAFDSDKHKLDSYRNVAPSEHHYPLPDLEDLMRAKLPAPFSVWQQDESKRFSDAISNVRQRLLLAPVQTQEYGLSASLRSLIQAGLSEALRAGGEDLLDPYLISRALGNATRRLPDTALFALADQLHATQILAPYAGTDQGESAVHPGPRQLKLTIRAFVKDTTGQWQPAPTPMVHQQAEFDDLNLPHEQLNTLLSPLLQELNVKYKLKQKSQVFRAAKIAEDFQARTLKRLRPESRALTFQLLGALAPNVRERVGNEFYERSLLAMETLPQSDPQAESMRARAYGALGFRPKALAMVADVEGPNAKFVLSWMNGNVSELDRLWLAAPSAAERVLAGLTLIKLRKDYGLDNTALIAQIAIQIFDLPAIWQPLALERLRLTETWHIPSSTALFSLWANLYPDVAEQPVASDSNAKLAPLSNAQLQELKNLPTQFANHWIERRSPADLSPSDGTELLLSWAIEQQYRLAYVDIGIRSADERGLAHLQALDEVALDQPDLTQLKAHAHENLASKTQSRAKKKPHNKKAREFGVRANYWEWGQTHTARRGWNAASSASSGSQPPPLFYWHDYPQAGFYTEYGVAMDNTISKFWRVELRRRGVRNAVDARRLQELLVGRFLGHPDRGPLLADLAMQYGDADAAVVALKASIAAQPRAIEAYNKLADIWTREGKVQAAQELLLTFPPFTDGEYDALKLSHLAGDAGDRFYWKGYPQLAKPFYRVAGELTVGSDANYRGAERWSTLEGDLQTAARYAATRIQQYDSAWGKRDFLGLATLLNTPEESLQLLESFLEKHQTLVVWESGIAVHRVNRSTDEQVRQWALAQLTSEGYVSGQSLKFLQRYFLTDRVVPDWLAEQTETMLGLTYRSGLKGFDMMLDPKLESGWIQSEKFGFNYYEQTKFPGTGAYEFPNETAMFLRATRQLQLGNNEQASVAFHEADELHNFLSNRTFIPDYAYAMASSKYASQLQEGLVKISTYPPARQARIGYQLPLARMLLDAFQGRHDAAVGHYHQMLALAEQGSDDITLYEYDIATALDRISRDLNEPRYRKLLLSWAEACVATKPWLAWAHAFIALNTDDVARSNAALATAIQLDPNSRLLQRFSDEQRAAALGSLLRRSAGARG